MKLKNNPLQNKSYDFALLIIKLSKKLVNENKEYILSKQILRSGTSVGAKKLMEQFLKQIFQLKYQFLIKNV